MKLHTDMTREQIGTSETEGTISKWIKKRSFKVQITFCKGASQLKYKTKWMRTHRTVPSPPRVTIRSTFVCSIFISSSIRVGQNTGSDISIE